MVISTPFANGFDSLHNNWKCGSKQFGVDSLFDNLEAQPQQLLGIDVVLIEVVANHRSGTCHVRWSCVEVNDIGQSRPQDRKICLTLMGQIAPLYNYGSHGFGMRTFLTSRYKFKRKAAIIADIADIAAQTPTLHGCTSPNVHLPPAKSHYDDPLRWQRR